MTIKILKFYTPTCMPCKVIGKILDKLENVEVEAINANEDVAMVDKYNVYATPTLVFLNDDKEYGRTHGLVTEAQIKELISQVS